ncbi:MAG: type I methionyl aminopeptidase [Candidatus Peribacteraceae bacterium]|nr:type I methionyl aminopeptidase [Candidatus Peribacteraceae bacterium]
MSRFQILTAAEMEAARESGRILRSCLEEVSRRAVPGVTTGELDRIAEDFIRSHGGEPAFKGYHGYPASLCVSVNDECVHGIPGARIVKEGDVIGLDCGVFFGGICTDACRTVIAGDASPRAAELVAATSRALEDACAIIRSGIRVGDISSRVQHSVEGAGFKCVYALTGHGLGKTLHQYPDIPNVGEAHTGPMVPAYTLLAVEPITSMGSDAIREGDDGWTIHTRDGAVAAHFEHTVLVLPEGHEILA